MLGYKDLAEALRQLTKQDKGVTLIKSEEEEIYISYYELWKKSMFLSYKLKDMGACKGTEVVIHCKNLENYIYAFWACVLGGFIAIPVDIDGNDYNADVNNKIFDKLNNPFILYDNVDRSIISSISCSEKIIDLEGISYEFIDSMLDNKTYMESKEEDIVYVQFSSGSTGEPKGAILRKSSIFANTKSFIDRFGMTSDDITLSWQPLTHCYGLIVFHVLPVMLGANQYLIPTEIFMQSPLLWFEKVNQHRATHLGAIPFAMKHFISFLEKSKKTFNWNLSCVKGITVGAEQIAPDLCSKFINMMKTYSLSENVLNPGYGLAEATTVVSVQGVNKPFVVHNIIQGEIEIGKKISFVEDNNYEKGNPLIQVGEPLSSIDVQITDDNGQALPNGVLGHIFIKGESVTTGYYNDISATEAVFWGDGWLDTGDLGFLIDGNLVVAGRQKEIVVVNGMKYTCTELEEVLNKKIIEKNFEQIVVCNGLNISNNTEEAIVFVQIKLDMNKKEEIIRFIQLSYEIKKVLYENSRLVINNVIPIDKVPKTYSGKIKRKELTNKFNEGEFALTIKQLVDLQKNNFETTLKSDICLSINSICSSIVEIIKKLFDINITDCDLAFQEYGIVSINIPMLVDMVNKMYDINIPIESLFNYPSINKFAEYVYSIICTKNKTNTNKDLISDSKVDKDKIAIIGMSCRFPGGANNIDDYWNLLMSGKDGISDIPSTRWELEKYYNENKEVPGKMYCKKGGFLDINIDEFDASFFNISPKEATALDPQQRMLLELTWEAFENANMDIKKYNGSNTGVYIGISTNEYMMSHLYSGDLTKIDAYSPTGTHMSTACGRISYTFGFEGPCLAVDTACSSALSALHLGCQAIKSGEANLVVVGGVNLILTPVVNIGFAKLHATAPDGHSKAFDATADGYGRGEGGGVIILKMLSDAIQDNDTILGVICGTGINQDGKSNGLTAPNGASQAKLIKSTLLKAHLSPNDVDYVEMHGTGTPLGDPIEVGSVVEAYCTNRDISNVLKIGSVKSNIGHLEAGAGMASIVKVLLSFKNGIIPANLNFNTPSPYIKWNEIPVKVVNEHTEWNGYQGIRRAGINGFGFGGSNAHIILEEYQKPIVEVEEKGQGINYILKISSRSKKSLFRMIENYTELIKNCDDALFSDIIYSAARGRTDLEYRFAVTGESREEVLYRLQSYLMGEEISGVFTSIVAQNKNICIKERKVVFMFTGQGSQYINMGRLLYDTNRVFRETIISCDKLFKPYIIKSIINLIYGENANNELIQKTIYAQPLIFAIEYSLYKLWESYGVKPEIVMGHSIGEYVAAVASEIISLEDAVKLVSIRGRLMDSAPGHGAMGTIFASEEIVSDMIKDYKKLVSIAVHNAEETCVISGDSSVVEKILSIAEKKGIRTRKLKVSHAFHSQLMEPILDDFKSVADEVEFSIPKIRFVSCLYAKEINEDQILDQIYWTTHIRDKVDFYKAIMSIHDKDNYVFLEVGSNLVLSALCKLIFNNEEIVTGSLSIKKGDSQQLAETISLLYTTGININWSNVEFFGKKNWIKKQLPNYQFDRNKFWSEPIYDCKGNMQSYDNSIHRLLGQCIESPYMQDSLIYQSVFSAEEPYFMKEHIIFDTHISPAAAHISMLLSAMQDIKNNTSCSLSEVELRSPLTIYRNEKRLVQVIINNIVEKESEFSIVSRLVDKASSKWVTHATGKITSDTEFFKNDVQVDIVELENMKYNLNSENGIYTAMHNGGFDLGEGFRRVTKSNCINGEGFCFIEPLTTVPNLDMYTLYPGIIDSILQTAFFVVPDGIYVDEKDKKNNKIMIPYYLGKVMYNYRESNKLWCRTKASRKDDILYGDIDVFNEKGEAIMKFQDIIAKYTNSKNILSEIGNNYSNIYYNIEWIKENELHRDLKDSFNYIVITDDIKNIEHFYMKLKEKKSHTILVTQDNTYIQDTKYSYRLDCGNEINWMNLMKSISIEDKNLKYKFLYFNGIVNKNKNSEDISSINLSSLKGLLYLVKAINKAGLSERSKIKIITKNVHSIGGIHSSNISQAPIWGFSKVLGIEFPQLYDGIIDIDDECLSNENDNLLFELSNENPEEVCLRAKHDRYISKLIKHSESSLKKNKKKIQIDIKENSTYLITGGTGALGMTYAEHLINQGAKYIILLCRHKPNEYILQKVKEFIDKGIHIEIAYGDVCKIDNLKNVIKEINTRFPQIKGVVHCAGTLCDKMIPDLTWNDFETVLNPKIYGTLNVYKVLEKNKIDFFIMLSSISSIMGNIGQSNYAAANYFMNNFAMQMEINKQPGYTVCWGPWKGSGMAVGKEASAQNMDNLGVNAFTPEMGIKIIKDFFDYPCEGLIIADIDWKKHIQSMGISENNKFLSNMYAELSESDTSSDVSYDSSIYKQLLELNQDDQKEFLLSELQKILGKVLGFSKEQLPSVDISFKEQGADSLMVFSMRTTINKLLNADINVSVFYNYPTLRNLVDYLIDNVLFIVDESTEEDLKISTEELLSEIEKLTE